MTYFGLAVFASNIVNYVALNVDKLLVGYFAGPVALGLYDRAYRFLLMPLQKVNGPLGSVVMPALSRLNQRPYEYQQVYNTAAIILIFVAAPIAAVAVAAPTWCVNVIFGPGWEAMVPIFQILAIGIVLQPIFNSLGWLLISQGRAKEQFYALSAEGVLRIVLVTIGSLWGPIGIACAATARLFLSLPLLFQLVGRRQTYPVRALWKVFGLAIACGLVSFIAVLPILKLAPFSTAPLVQLLLLATIAVLASISVLAVFSTSRRAAHQLFAELQKMLNRA